jgi:hypothetical protein
MKLFAPALVGLGLVALVVASPTAPNVNTDVAASRYKNDATHM